MKKKIAASLCLICLGFGLGSCGSGNESSEHIHHLSFHEEEASTCIRQGHKSYYRCDLCDQMFSDDQGTYRIDQPESLPLRNHALSYVPAEESTYTKAGHQAYFVCSVCHRMFSDGKGTEPISEEETKTAAKTKFVQKTWRDLNYCEYLPQIERGERVPLILFLHGSGERGNDNESQLKNAILKVVNDSSNHYSNSIVLAPQCPSGKQWVDTPWIEGNYTLDKVKESETMQKVVSLIEAYRAREDVDADRVYVIGLSMGGFGAWDILARHSDLFAAGVPICGGGPIDAADILKDKPIYTFHGSADTSVPPEGTREMVEMIRNRGGNKIRFIEFEGLGHWIWDRAITFAGDEGNPSLEQWLFDQTASAYRVEGVLKDTENVPFKDAFIQLSQEDLLLSSHTDEFGRFAFSFIGGGECRIRIGLTDSSYQVQNEENMTFLLGERESIFVTVILYRNPVIWSPLM